MSKTVSACICGGTPTVTLGYHQYEIVCHDCYDGAPDSPNRCDFAADNSLDDAIQEWNELQEHLREVIT